MDLDENVIAADIEAQSIKKAYIWQEDENVETDITEGTGDKFEAK